MLFQCSLPSFSSQKYVKIEACSHRTLRSGRDRAMSILCERHSIAVIRSCIFKKLSTEVVTNDRLSASREYQSMNEASYIWGRMLPSKIWHNDFLGHTYHHGFDLLTGTFLFSSIIAIVQGESHEKSRFSSACCTDSYYYFVLSRCTFYVTICRSGFIKQRSESTFRLIAMGVDCTQNVKN